MTTMDSKSTINIVRSVAGSVGIDPDLAQAIAEVETNLDPTRTRYEEKYTYLVTPDKFAKLLGISELTETIFQKISWGALQVMGANARALGFQSQLPTLIQPQLGALYGCRHLHGLHKRYESVPDIIAAYNAGHAEKVDGKYINQPYVDKVMEKLIRLRRLK